MEEWRSWIIWDTVTSATPRLCTVLVSTQFAKAIPRVTYALLTACRNLVLTDKTDTKLQYLSIKIETFPGVLFWTTVLSLVHVVHCRRCCIITFLLGKGT